MHILLNFKEIFYVVTNVMYLDMDICVRIKKLNVKFGKGSVDFHVFEHFYFTRYTKTKVEIVLPRKVHMFSWMSGLQNPLIQNDFIMFQDEWMSVKSLCTL